MFDIPPPNRADFLDSKEYKRARERWRYATRPDVKARASARSIKSRKNDPRADEKRRTYQNGRYQSDPEYRAKINGKNRKFAADNIEYTKARVRAYYHEHKEEQREKRKDYFTQYHERNREKTRKRSKEHYQANPSYYQIKSRFRQEGLLRATPKWLTKEQRAAISAVYREARKLTKCTGLLHVVDHIHPLKGKKACGLHVPWNLQVITADANLRKACTEALQ